MLVRLMLRTCFVEALKGRTSVGARVYDSALEPLDKVGCGPFLSVYTGQGELTAPGGHSARPLFGTSRCLLVFQYGLTEAMVEVDPQTNETTIIGFGFPPVDAGLQLSLDIIGRQLAGVLVTPVDEWGRFAQKIAPAFRDVRLEPGISNDDGVRVATHQLSMLANLVQEPVTRNALIDEYLALLSASADPLHVEQRGLIEGLVSSDMEETEAARRTLGQSMAVWQSSPLAAVGDNEGQPFDEATIAIEGRQPAAVTV